MGEAGDANVDPKDTCDDNSDYPDEILPSTSTLSHMRGHGHGHGQRSGCGRNCNHTHKMNVTVGQEG